MTQPNPPDEMTPITDHAAFRSQYGGHVPTEVAKQLECKLSELRLDIEHALCEGVANTDQGKRIANLVGNCAAIHLAAEELAKALQAYADLPFAIGEAARTALAAHRNRSKPNEQE